MARKTPSDALQAVVRPLGLALHEVEVTLTLPAAATVAGAVLALPAWTPGSYLVRDYARFLDRIQAVSADGQPCPLEKLDKQRWRLAPSAGPVTVSYRLFCNDLTVRTNHVDAAHAHLVGAATFLYLEGEKDWPTEVVFQGWPAGWKVATALPRRGEAYFAADHDTLVDSPFELGEFRMHAFSAGGAVFQLAITGEHPGDETRILEATRALVEVGFNLFGGFPFERYLFLLTFSPKSRGGLEHRDCSSLLADPLSLDRPEGYWELYTLIAHEFFHVWNVKRMRDRVLGPFDYQRENPTRLLWFHEGFTSFMQYSIVLQAGLVPWSWVVRKLAGSWADNCTRAGRLEQSLEESSFDAWIRHYKPTEFSTNSTVSYYDKGAMVAWMMDAELRLASHGGHGLDRFFRFLWDRVGDGPLTDADLRDTYLQLTGRDPGPFWAAHIQGTAELEKTNIEKAYGLSLTARAPWELLGAGEAGDPQWVRRTKAYSGLTWGGDDPHVQNVALDSPAARAGLSYGMEILAVAGWRTRTGPEIQARFGDAAPGDTVAVLAAHRGRVRSYAVALVENPERTCQIIPDPSATPAQRSAFQAWTGQPFPVAATRVGMARR